MGGIRCALVVVAILAASPGWAETYHVKFHRPDGVGDKFIHEVSAFEHQIIKIDGDAATRQNRSDYIGVDARIETEILKVTANAKPQEARVYMHRFRTRRSPTGDWMVGTTEGQELHVYLWPKFRVKRKDRAPVPVREQEELFLLFTETDDKMIDDDIFGTKHAVEPGDSWSLNTKAMVQTFDDMKVRPTDVSGDVKLAGLEVVNNQLSQRLVVKVNVRDFQAIPDFTDPKGNMSLRFEGLFPLDESAPVLSETLRATLKYTGRRGAGAVDATVESQTTRTTVLWSRAKTAVAAPGKDNNCKELLASGQGLADQGDYDEARETYQRVYAQCGDPVALVMTARTYQDEGNLPMALTYCERFLKEAPKHPLAKVIATAAKDLRKKLSKSK